MDDTDYRLCIDVSYSADLVTSDLFLKSGLPGGVVPVSGIVPYITGPNITSRITGNTKIREFIEKHKKPR